MVGKILLANKIWYNHICTGHCLSHFKCLFRWFIR